MPYDDPEPTDPHELVGVVLPGDEAATREMAAAFADEFARLGFSRRRILALFQSSFYAGAHAALNALGEAEIERLIDESLSVWGRFQTVIEDAGADAMVDRRHDDTGPLVGPNGMLRVLR